MHEGAPTSESREKITREQVIGVYRKFVERGIDNPDDLDLDDAKVIEANDLFEKWMEQGDADSEGDEDREGRVNFERTMLYVDAGFINPNYLKDVLGWLSQDAQNAEKDKSNSNRVKLRKDIAEAMVKIRKLIHGTI